MKHVMGILNSTPDSFYSASRAVSECAIARRVWQIAEEGGAIIDVGCCSTRPGSVPVPAEEEERRLRLALAVVARQHTGLAISVDTFRPHLMHLAAQEYGATIFNDVSGRVPPARCSERYVLMSSAADAPAVLADFRSKVPQLLALGYSERDIVLDPGFGFGKDVVADNYAVLRALHTIKEAFPECPLLAGMSRKRMVWQLLGTTPDSPRALTATACADLIALQQGADILRVHDVQTAADTITLYNNTRG